MMTTVKTNCKKSKLPSTGKYEKYDIIIYAGVKFHHNVKKLSFNVFNVTGNIKGTSSENLESISLFLTKLQQYFYNKELDEK